MNNFNDKLRSSNVGNIEIRIEDSDLVPDIQEDTMDTSVNNSNYLSVSSVTLKSIDQSLPRRPSIFDYINHDSLDSDELEDAKNSTFIKKSFSNNYIQDSSRVSLVPLLKVSKSFESTEKG